MVQGNDRSAQIWQQINPLVRFFTLSALSGGGWGVRRGGGRGGKRRGSEEGCQKLRVDWRWMTIFSFSPHSLLFFFFFFRFFFPLTLGKRSKLQHNGVVAGKAARSTEVGLSSKDAGHSSGQSFWVHRDRKKKRSTEEMNQVQYQYIPAFHFSTWNVTCSLPLSYKTLQVTVFSSVPSDTAQVQLADHPNKPKSMCRDWASGRSPFACAVALPAPQVSVAPLLWAYRRVHSGVLSSPILPPPAPLSLPCLSLLATLQAYSALFFWNYHDLDS